MNEYHFKRFFNGREKAEGARTRANSFEEALAKVSSWYPPGNTFELTTDGPCEGASPEFVERQRKRELAALGSTPDAKGKQ